MIKPDTVNNVVSIKIVTKTATRQYREAKTEERRSTRDQFCAQWDLTLFLQPRYVYSAQQQAVRILVLAPSAVGTPECHELGGILTRHVPSLTGTSLHQSKESRHH